MICQQLRTLSVESFRRYPKTLFRWACGCTRLTGALCDIKLTPKVSRRKHSLSTRQYPLVPKWKSLHSQWCSSLLSPQELSPHQGITEEQDEVHIWRKCRCCSVKKNSCSSQGIYTFCSHSFHRSLCNSRKFKLKTLSLTYHFIVLPVFGFYQSGNITSQVWLTSNIVNTYHFI